MWPAGRFDGASASSSQQPDHPSRGDRPDGATGDLFNAQISSWQCQGSSVGQPIGRGRLIEMSRSQDPGGEIRRIESERRAMDDSNLFKTPEQIANEHKRWKEILSGEVKSREAYTGQSEDSKRAMFPYDYKSPNPKFQLKDDDFPPL